MLRLLAALACAAPLTAQSFTATERALATTARTTGLAAALAAHPAAVIGWPGMAVRLGLPAEVAGPRTQLAPLGLLVAPDTSLALAWGVAAPLGGDPLDLSGRYLAAWSRREGAWHLDAFLVTAPLDTLPGGARRITPPAWPAEAEPFAAADRAFAARALEVGAAAAFAESVAPHGVLFGAEGRHVIGPAAIARQMAPTEGSRWNWGPVAAGSSDDGTLGWTIGEATIAPPGGGPAARSKYLTLWQRQPDGTIRWIADGGNARP